MNTQSHDELISAALDGEVVDVSALRRALNTPEARQTLAAFVVLRSIAAADRCETVTEHQDEAGLARPGHGAAWRYRRRLALEMAACLAAATLAGWFWFGARSQPHPPVVLPVATGAPDAWSGADASAASGPSDAEQPPAPRRTLHFAPGEWRRLGS